MILDLVDIQAGTSANYFKEGVTCGNAESCVKPYYMNYEAEWDYHYAYKISCECNEM